MCVCVGGGCNCRKVADPGQTPLWTLAQSLLCDPNPQAPTLPVPRGPRPKTMLLLCLKLMLRRVDVCVPSGIEFHRSGLKWNQKLGSWTAVLEACAWQRASFAEWCQVPVVSYNLRLYSRVKVVTSFAYFTNVMTHTAFLVHPVQIQTFVK